jgi:hypothetical protein
MESSRHYTGEGSAPLESGRRESAQTRLAASGLDYTNEGSPAAECEDLRLADRLPSGSVPRPGRSIRDTPGSRLRGTRLCRSRG